VGHGAPPIHSKEELINQFKCPRDSIHGRSMPLHHSTQDNNSIQGKHHIQVNSRIQDNNHIQGNSTQDNNPTLDNTLNKGTLVLLHTLNNNTVRWNVIILKLKSELC